MRYLKLTGILVLSVLLLSGCSGQEQQKDDKRITRFFKTGDKVVFVGNSITNMGMFHNNIYLFHVTRFPDKPLEMFNKGVSGDVTGGVLDRMYDDILSENPTVAVMMLGMNDVRRWLYGPLATTDEDTLRLRREAVAEYKTRMDSIVRLFLSKDVRVILERPTIYDQTALLPEKNHLGVNDVLGECAVYIDSLGKKYDLPVVDYYTIMNRIELELQKKDPSATLTGQDRIHPGETGHLIMAYQFLKAEQVPKYVSRIIIDAEKQRAAKESENCKTEKIKSTDNGISFIVEENALPFPVKKEQAEALRLVPFMQDMNVELLKVTGLSDGEYVLKIDDTVIDDFTGRELEEGVNLASYANTPQMEQAAAIRSKLEELWGVEKLIRGMKFIEYMDAYKNYPKKDDLKAVGVYLDSLFSKKYQNPYYKNQLKKYLVNKSKEQELSEMTKKIRDTVYELAIPEAHSFKLTKR
jgi:endoglucanase